MTVSLDGTGVDPALAVAAVPNAATAYLALTEVAHLKPGERVLVHGALGGLASTFPGVARTLGAASVVGTVRRTSLAAGQASALPYERVIASEDLLDAVDGQRFDVVIDPIGGQVRTDSLQVMAPLGRMLLVGNASGDWEHTVSTNALWRANIALLGFNVGSYLPAHPEQTPRCPGRPEGPQPGPGRHPHPDPPARPSRRSAPPLGDWRDRRPDPPDSGSIRVGRSIKDARTTLSAHLLPGGPQVAPAAGGVDQQQNRG
jgi:hypothetical protein